MYIADAAERDMSFGSFSDGKHPAPMAEINVTPMVDVMLVLLVIFIITAPLFTHAIQLELPTAQSAPAQVKAETITVSIDGAGKIYWNEAALQTEALAARFAASAKLLPQPDLQLRADKATRYEVIAQVMAAAQANGIARIGFITEPNTPSTPVQENK
jgi:biopolymer transport protein ExbD